MKLVAVRIAGKWLDRLSCDIWKLCLFCLLDSLFFLTIVIFIVGIRAAEVNINSFHASTRQNNTKKTLKIEKLIRYCL